MCTDKSIVGQDQLMIDDEKAMKNEWMIWGPHLSTCKCTLGATSKTQPAVDRQFRPILGGWHCLDQ